MFKVKILILPFLLLITSMAYGEWYEDVGSSELSLDDLIHTDSFPERYVPFTPPEERLVDTAKLLKPPEYLNDSNSPSGTPRWSCSGNASLYARNALWDEVIENRIGDIDGSGGFNPKLKKLIQGDPLRTRLLKERAVVAINPADFSPEYRSRIFSLPKNASTISKDAELSRLATATLGMVLWAETPKGLKPVLVMDMFQSKHAAQDLRILSGSDSGEWFVGDFHIGWLEQFFGLSWDRKWKRISGNLPEQAPRVTLHLF